MRIIAPTQLNWVARSSLALFQNSASVARASGSAVIPLRMLAAVRRRSLAQSVVVLRLRFDRFDLDPFVFNRVRPRYSPSRSGACRRGDTTQPAPAPRFSRTAPEVSRPPARTGEHGEEVLASFGFPAEEIRRLRESKAIA